MKSLGSVLNQNIRYRLRKGSHPVLFSVFEQIFCHTRNAELEYFTGEKTPSDGVLITIHEPQLVLPKEVILPEKLPESYTYVRISEGGNGIIIGSHPRYIFQAIHHLLAHRLDDPAEAFAEGVILEPSFREHRSTYDYFLTQEGRITVGFDRDDYLARLAKQGFTHAEVNGLAYPMGLEQGSHGEVYPMFYTYCPALDQFVHSDLNRGLYPYYYLAANLEYLKSNAAMARKYGMVPGLLCFEPRAVPEEFFQRYPMLRGARVDHPFRSFRPRYTMTTTHPRVLEHYAQMLTRLLEEVPDLGYLTIWTNDSGAGFEHTQSLYVGRNGGPYLVREWKNHEEIAKLAGENVLRFFRTLRDAARKINPEFRIITRMESFYGEHDIIIEGLEEGIEIESASLIQRGWEMPYSHPRYPDRKDLNAGSLYQQDFYPEEKTSFDPIEKRGSGVSYYFSCGPNVMFAPLTGIPYPKLTRKRLETLHRNGVGQLSHLGGSFPPERVPYDINHEVVAGFQFDRDQQVDELIQIYLRNILKETDPGPAVRAWDLVEDGILGFPNLSSLYSTIGFTWYRLWVRPLVPDIENIPQADRDYYEKFMCTVPHNPNNVDLSRDVLFTLTTPERSREDAMRMADQVIPPLDEAVEILRSVHMLHPFYHDQWIRIRALRCWMTTQMNIALWVECVYGYMRSEQPDDRNEFRLRLQSMILAEIANTIEIKDLLASGVDFMALTDQGETPLVHGTNLSNLLDMRILLMERHLQDEPRIDHDYMERKAGQALH